MGGGGGWRMGGGGGERGWMLMAGSGEVGFSRENQGMLRVKWKSLAIMHPCVGRQRKYLGAFYNL